MNDALDTPEFYALCRAYREAHPAFIPDEAEALEILKQWIRDMRSFIHSPEEIAAASGQSDFS